MEGFVWIVLSAWLAVSAMAQLSPALLSRLRQHDILCLVPRWNFFAPVPGTYDFVVVYRDRMADGTISRWSEVRRQKSNRYVASLWNPGRRHNKAIFDVAQQLAVVVGEVQRLGRDPSAVTISVPYLLLLNHVSALQRSELVIARQFAVMLSSGADVTEKPQAVFLSALHPLGSR